MKAYVLWSKHGVMAVSDPSAGSYREKCEWSSSCHDRTTRRFAKFKARTVHIISGLAFAFSSAASALTCYDLNGAYLYSQEFSPVYLGFFGSTYSSDSVMNQFGTYGSQYNSNSVRNSFGAYGSSYGTYSANNSFSNSAPKILKNGLLIGYLTTNQYVTGGLSLATIDASCSFTATSAVIPLSIPDGLTNLVSLAYPTQVALAWNASSGATGYRVYQCADAACSSFTLLGTASSNSTTITSLSPAQTYNFAVEPFNSAGAGAYAAITVTTSADTTAPVIEVDVTPPTLETWDLSPPVVNVDQSSAEVKATFHISDESGVKTPSVTASHSSGQSTGFASVSLKSGDIYDGIWEAVLTINQGAAPGIWNVSLFPLEDNLGNDGSFGPPASYMSSFSVATNLNPDTSAPTLDSWNLSPTVVNVDQSSAEVKATFHISDESGVKTPSVTASHSSGQSTGFASVSLKSGDIYDGIWEAVLTINQGAAPGTWNVSLFPLEDNLGNDGSFGPPASYMSSFSVVTNLNPDTSAPRRGLNIMLIKAALDKKKAAQ